MVWLVFPVVYEKISCPNPDFIPMSKFSILKMGPNTKWEIFANFEKFKTSLKIEVDMGLKFLVLIPFMDTN